MEAIGNFRMQTKRHWEDIYSAKGEKRVSWYQEHARTSLEIIRRTAAPKSARIIDVGGGASTLVDDLLADGYRELAVLDISAEALHAAKLRLGGNSSLVDWIEADITAIELPARHYDVWHDRAVFHFLTDEEARRKYVAAVLRSVKPGGHVIVATFGPNGPLQCSGLAIVRYSPESLHDAFGAQFVLIEHKEEAHVTPAGGMQQFIYCYCRMQDV
jgi:2-polyprenyl-3-methyl-5-hydroxy-6-metoxy-1,4-benzoquinol methylase